MLDSYGWSDRLRRLFQPFAECGFAPNASAWPQRPFGDKPSPEPIP